MKRREFNKLAGLSALTLHSLPALSSATLFAAEVNDLPRVPLGVCDHALRGMQPTADYMVDYKMLRRGEPLELLEPPDGVDQEAFDIQHQQSELEASLDYLREHCHVGRNHLT